MFNIWKIPVSLQFKKLSFKLFPKKINKIEKIWENFYGFLQYFQNPLRSRNLFTVSPTVLNSLKGEY